MTYPNLQQWQYIELTMKDKSSGTSSTYYLSNRAIIDDTNVGRYFPLIKSIGSLGSRMGTFLPESTSATITLDDSPGSYGYERRFSDLLERQTPIQQSIKIYLAQTELTDLNVTADFVLAWQGVVVGIDMDRGDGNDRLSLKVSSVPLPVREVTKQVSIEDWGPSYNPPASAYGQYLPLILGSNVEVAPVKLSSTGSTAANFAYGTTLGTTYPLGGVQAYYAKNYANDYVQVQSAGTTTTVIMGNNYAGDTNGGVLANTEEFLFPIASSNTVGYIISKLEVDVQGIFGGANTFTAAIWDAADVIGTKRQRLGIASISATTTNGVNQTLTFSFSDPVVLAGDHTYYLGLTAENASAVYLRYLAAGPTSTIYYRTNSAGESAPWITSAYNKTHVFRLYGAVLTDNYSGSGTVNSSTGLGHAYVYVTQGGSADLSKLNLILAVNGIKDDGSGTCTGSASSLIESPIHAIKLLDKAWNGSTWTGGSFDFTIFSTEQTAATTTTNRWYRKIAGATSGRALATDIMAEIAKNGAIRVGMRNGGSTPLVVWPWGYTTASVATISDEDARVRGVQISGTETIINRAFFVYNKSLVTFDPIRAANNELLKNYTGTQNWYNGLNAYVTDLTSTSETLYGVRPVGNVAYDWLKDSASASIIADYLLRTYQHPHIFVDFEVPYFKYSTVDMLQIVNIVHPDLPSYFGTSANATLPYYLGSAVDVLEGRYWKRAKEYRAQVEGREIFFDRDNIPKLRLVARLLVNSNDPT